MLTQEQLAFYHEHGYILVEQLLTRAEAADLRQECHELIERLSAHKKVDATWGSAREGVAGAPSLSARPGRFRCGRCRRPG